YTAQQRAKEMSIRKVLGASAWQLITLLSRDSVKLIVVAILVAAPLIWWGMDTWLSQFVYHVPLQPLVMVIAGIGALLVAWLTTALQSMKIARRNPVKSLRQE
ncbi:MAG: FtsX-like permease family protein, partial [Bacteroidota bacterium]